MRRAILAAWLTLAMVDLQASAMVLTWCGEPSLRAAEVTEMGIFHGLDVSLDNGTENALITIDR